MFLNREKETSRVSTLEIISFSSDCFSGFLSLIEVKDGGIDTDSRSACFLEEKIVEIVWKRKSEKRSSFDEKTYLSSFHWHSLVPLKRNR